MPFSAPFLVWDGVTLAVDDQPAFSNTHWIICEDEQWAILGSNASGKSLLGRALTGAVRVLQGEIQYPFAGELPTAANGRPLAAAEQAVALVSPQSHRELLAQESSFYQSRWHSGLGEGHQTVREFLSQACVEGVNPFEVNPLLSSPVRFHRQRAEHLAQLGAHTLLRRRLLHLSNGEMRKILLVRALLRFPRVLVLDDPYGGLDVHTRQVLCQLMNRWMMAGLKVIPIVSRLSEIPEETTHVLLVDAHQVVAQGAKRRILRHALARSLGTRDVSLSSPLPKAHVRRPAQVRPTPYTQAAPVVLRNIWIAYGRKHVLKNVSWTIHTGEHWALLGPNGAGKSTLLSLIQVDNPQVYAQDITLFGLRPDSTQALWRARGQMGWVSPELQLHYPGHWSCLAVVCSGFAESIGLHQECSPAQRRVALRWLRALGMETMAGRNLGELSTGEQRFVLLARAMVKHPRLLILDEPCQGLDRIHRNQVLEAIDTVVEASKAQLIFVTHHAREMPRCITHVLRLAQGRIVSRRALNCA